MMLVGHVFEYEGVVVLWSFLALVGEGKVPASSWGLCKNRQIVFIAHSLGGILVKKVRNRVVQVAAHSL